MELLVLGVALWWIAHLQKSLGAPLRAKAIDAVGANRWQGIVTLMLISSVVLMVLGWRGSVPSPVYAAPGWGRLAATPLMLLALYLFAASAQPSNVKRVLRHPQLTGFALWTLAHLLSNGDQRSLVLFGGLGVWALLEMPLINRRDGAYEAPEPVPLAEDVKLVVGAVILFAVLYFVHPWIAGTSPRPF